ncbi:LysE family transporter [Tabrizicola sp.]|uniref:LysE family translocator n=1 Tax=Tabrizicola sp. TaxID=2005166 RepID=UPI000BDA6DFC|nr:LysE family transporter [Tabrizicola sp.]MBY0352191.1 LysE family transporter [Tabrizicola sp.]MDK2774236.1 LysE family transporter [Tabrizicola sp.]OYX20395.1 MAG: transporter [Rhodobacterales bacterium 32-66-9]
MTLAAFLAVAGLLTMGAVSPGPAVLMSARTGVTEGVRTGFFLSLGIGAGAVFWATLALSGLALVFQIAPTLLWAFKILGGLYLVWMAIGMWRHAADPLPVVTDVPPRSALSAFRLGLFTQLANPKPAVLLSAIFVGTVPPGTGAWVLVALLAYLFLVETGWNTIVARIFSLDRTRAGYISLKTVIDRSFGGLLALLGIKIAAT